MHEHGKSYSSIVPVKLSNKSVLPLAERAEGSGLTKGNLSQQDKCRTQCRESLQSALGRIRQAAAGDKTLRFTSLWHHVCNLERLREEYYNIKRHASPGIDGQTWQEYGEGLENNLQDLSRRLSNGGYRAKPVKRAYIPCVFGKPEKFEIYSGQPELWSLPR